MARSRPPSLDFCCPKRLQLADEELSNDGIEAIQLRKLNHVLKNLPPDSLYAERLAPVRLPLDSLDQLEQIPFLTKRQLIRDAHHPIAGSRDDDHRGSIFELPTQAYARLHQTSGTSGFPITVLDTAEDWCWWLDCWDFVLDAAQVDAADIALMAFSFGPFIGFWTANDALVRRGCLVVPGGGVSSETRLRMIDQHQCTIVCCTPTYALHLAAVAEKMGFDLRRSSVSRLIVAGEPGGSLASVRQRIEEAWGASVIDHAGASEVGAWGFGTSDGKGLHVIESEFIAEIRVFEPSSDDRADEPTPSRLAAEGEPGELVLTNLGRLGGPAIRYRTGDMVCGRRDHAYSSPFLFLDGGVLGRADDMLVVRGVNVFPSSIESIIRGSHPTAEFRLTLFNQDEMDQLSIQLEGTDDLAARLASQIRERLAMRVSVQAVPEGTLPTFEAKAKRVIDKRKTPFQANEGSPKLGGKENTPHE